MRSGDRPGLQNENQPSDITRNGWFFQVFARYLRVKIAGFGTGTGRTYLPFFVLTVTLHHCTLWE